MCVYIYIYILIGDLREHEDAGAVAEVRRLDDDVRAAVLRMRLILRMYVYIYIYIYVYMYTHHRLI